MPRSALFAALLAVLAGGAAWILFGPNTAADGLQAEVAEVDTASSDDRAEAKTTEVAPAVEADAPLERVSVPAEAEQSTKLAATNYLAHFEGEGALHITVVDAESEQPVPSASVYVIKRDEVDDEELERAFSSGELSFLELAVKYGKAYRANELGVVMLPPLADEYPLLFASQDSRFGFTWRIEKGVTEATIEIQEERWLAVSVVDAAGHPAPNAPINLRMSSTDFSYDIMSKYTDENGQTELRNMGPYLESARENAMGELFVAAGIPLKPDQINDTNQVLVDDDLLASHQARIVLPVTGEVKVMVVTPHGEKFEGEGNVALWSDESDSFMGRGNIGGVKVEDGTAHFSHVGLGTKVKAALVTTNRSDDDSIEFDGPTRPGEVIEVQIIREDRTIVVGTLVDDNGLARADTELQFRYRMHAGWNRRNNHASATTDENGRFSYELPKLTDVDDKLSHNLTVYIPSESGAPMESMHELPEKLPLGEHDLGSVLLEQPTLAVAGRVIDQLGKAIENARIGISKIDADADEHMREYARHFGDLGLHEKSSKDGSFAFYNELPRAAEYQLHFSIRGYEDLDVSFQPGQENLEVVLNKSSIIVGSILLDEEVPRGDINVVTETQDGNSHWARLRSGEADGEWAIEAEVSANTPVSLVINTDLGVELYRQDGLIVNSGETLKPPSLQPLDLRGQLNLIKILVYSPSGEAMPFEVAVASEHSHHREDADASGAILIAAEPIESVHVYAEGYASKQLTQVHSDQSVVLEPALEVYLEVPTEFVDYRGTTMSVMLSPAGDSHSVSFHSSTRRCTFGANGRGKLLVDGPGTYRVSYRVARKKGNSSRSSGFSAGEISVSSAGQVIRLDPPRDRLDRTVDRLLKDD